MNTKKITLNELKKLLSDSALRNILGGSGAPTSCYTKCKSDDCPVDKPECVRIGSSSDCTCSGIIG